MHQVSNVKTKVNCMGTLEYIYILQVSGAARSQAADVLFRDDSDGDGNSIPSAVLDSLLKCPIGHGCVRVVRLLKPKKKQNKQTTTTTTKTLNSDRRINVCSSSHLISLSHTPARVLFLSFSFSFSLFLVDVRSAVVQNVVVVGGTSMLPGFSHRLKDCIQELSRVINRLHPR
jgi:actin-related protein